MLSRIGGIHVVSALAIGFTIVTTSIGPGAAQAAPDPKNQKGYTSFVATLSALNASAADVIAMERGAARLALVRQAITQKLLALYQPNAPSVKTLDIAEVLDPSTLLCGLRAQSVTILEKISERDSSAKFVVDHLQTVARANYVSSVAAEIQSVSKSSPPGDIISALQALFASYQVQASNASLQPAAIEKIRARTLQRCQGDLKEFDRAYYGTEIKAAAAPAANAPEPAAAGTGLPSLSFLGSIGVLIDTVLGVISPVVIEGATIVDEAKREKAIREFLSESKNQAAIRRAGTELARAVSYYTFAKRMAQAGSFAEQLAVISAIKVDPSKIDACADPDQRMFDRSPSGGPSALFMRCYHAVWLQFRDPVSSALKTASDYDLLADAGDTSAALTSFQKITSDFGAIAGSPISPDEFWGYVTQLVNFAGAVSTAFSRESNQD